tara:strand:+ start:188 stop:310 length:123 start_codon:yes stop_codon:yes gene_type:complete
MTYPQIKTVSEYIKKGTGERLDDVIKVFYYANARDEAIIA